MNEIETRFYNTFKDIIDRTYISREIIYNVPCDIKAYFEEKENMCFNIEVTFNAYEKDICIKEICTFEEQCEVEGFVADFYIQYGILSEGYVIEIDGHEFHEKTKDQAKRDRERERLLTRKGNIVIRFTGSEVYIDPVKCVKELIQIISERMVIIKIKELEWESIDNFRKNYREEQSCDAHI
jgi:very-short-patch-repair endonuclease